MRGLQMFPSSFRAILVSIPRLSDKTLLLFVLMVAIALFSINFLGKNEARFPMEYLQREFSHLSHSTVNRAKVFHHRKNGFLDKNVRSVGDGEEIAFGESF